MGFKSVDEYNDEKYRDVFRIPNDGEHLDVIFLLRSESDLGVWDAHYIKSAEFSGYVECCGIGCPACSKNIRIQSRKIFIPLYNITTGKVEFWDRTYTFLTKNFKPAVLEHYANPSEFVFRVTRKGEANSRDTTYDIQAVARNTVMSYDQIMTKFNLVHPKFYDIIIKSFDSSELGRILSPHAVANASTLSDYVPTPRAGYASAIPDAYVDSSTLVADNTPVADVFPTVNPTDTAEVSIDSDPAIDTDDADGDEYPEPTF